jgi:2-polyprenyl-6-hydroxyphenyl methylase/3-demethylubiquinone-9 3-methyltransferase
MKGYYEDKLSAERLKLCYEIAPPRVQQYLKAEIEHVLGAIRPGDAVLELGCGYGRILPSLAKKASLVIGIDNSLSSLFQGIDFLKNYSNCHLAAMNAINLGFQDEIFDCVVCIQNGISAFHVNRQDLIRESFRVTKPGGIMLFSSYSDKFWKERLQWFGLQSEAGLVGEIDWEKTKHGVIVCRDGFTANTVRAEEFLSLTAGLDVKARIVEVDESSLFCEMVRCK